jgi:hypothetical protein
MLSKFWAFIISVAFWVFPYSKFVNAASLTALFKHIRGVEEPSTDDVIREKVLNFVRDKVRKHVFCSDCQFSWSLYFFACFKIIMNTEF